MKVYSKNNTIECALTNILNILYMLKSIKQKFNDGIVKNTDDVQIFLPKII